MSEVLLPCSECGEDLWLGIVSEVVAGVTGAEVDGRGGRGDVVDGVGVCGPVAEVAEEQAKGIEGWCEMEGARPTLFAAADAERGAVAGESAECSGNANRTSGVGADGCDGG